MTPKGVSYVSLIQKPAMLVFSGVRQLPLSGVLNELLREFARHVSSREFECPSSCSLCRVGPYLIESGV